MTLQDFLRFIGTRKLCSQTDRILLAVSGGIDSMVMAHLFHQAKFQFAIVHCNFGLRGHDSNDDADFVNKLASTLNVPIFSEKFDTLAISSQKGISIQMAARDLRYDWFEKIRQENGFDYIATAHHLDDQVETFLINLIRGTGIAGLHGIPVKNNLIIRPLMFAFRKDIEQYATQNQIRYRTDLSNKETKYVRNKIRHEVIPLLCNINPEFRHGLTESIRKISEFEQIGHKTLENWSKNALTTRGKDKTIEISRVLTATPVEPYAWSLLSPFGFNGTQVANLIACLEKDNRKIFLSPTHRLVKDRGQLVINRIGLKIPDKPVTIKPFARKKTITKPLILFLTRISQVEKYKIPASENMASLDFNKLKFPLTVRHWHQGDAFFPLGMKKKKKLSDFFIDQKFTIEEKDQTWLLCSGNQIVWIIGHRIDNRFRVTSATQEVLSILMK